MLLGGCEGVLACAPSQPTTGIDGCCARAASGQAATAPLINLMNSRRFMASPHLDTGADGKQFSARVQEPTDVRCGSIADIRDEEFMSALPRKAEIGREARMSACANSGHAAIHSITSSADRVKHGSYEEPLARRQSGTPARRSPS